MKSRTAPPPRRTSLPTAAVTTTVRGAARATPAVAKVVYGLCALGVVTSPLWVVWYVYGPAAALFATLAVSSWLACGVWYRRQKSAMRSWSSDRARVQQHAAEVAGTEVELQRAIHMLLCVVVNAVDPVLFSSWLNAKLVVPDFSPPAQRIWIEVERVQRVGSGAASVDERMALAAVLESGRGERVKRRQAEQVIEAMEAQFRAGLGGEE